ncbi:MAG: hypothetical protein LAQ69_45485 [Acidobacteriia bacterium]|nr:hypothetical protein [Terriglobia bacterium]
MGPAPSHLQSLTQRLGYWEWAEYVSSALVTVGCLGEFSAEFTDWFTDGVDERKKRLAKCSTLLLVSSLAFELVCLVVTNQISGAVIGSLDTKAEQASTKALRAIDDAEIAIQRARNAVGEAENAIVRSGQAEAGAAKAVRLVDSANRQLAELESHVLAVKSYADSIVANANPRSLTFDSRRFMEIMKRVPRGIAEIRYVPNDPEARGFAYTIYQALGPGGAGWDVRGIGEIQQGAGMEATTGLGVMSRMRSDVPPTGDDIPIREALQKAITSGTSWEGVPEPPTHITAQPDHIFIVVVGRHQFRVPLWVPPWQSDNPKH